MQCRAPFKFSTCANIYNVRYKETTLILTNRDSWGLHISSLLPHVTCPLEWPKTTTPRLVCGGGGALWALSPCPWSVKDFLTVRISLDRDNTASTPPYDSRAVCHAYHTLAMKITLLILAHRGRLFVALSVGGKVTPDLWKHILARLMRLCICTLPWARQEGLGHMQLLTHASAERWQASREGVGIIHMLNKRLVPNPLKHSNLRLSL